MLCEPLPAGSRPVFSHALVACTIGSLLGSLPGGVVATGAPTTYTLRPPTMGLRRRLSELRERKDLRDRPGKHLTEWIGLSLETLDGEAVAGQKPGAVPLTLSRCGVGDLIFLALVARLEAHGGGRLDLPDGVCQACGGDLRGLGVAIEDLEVMRYPRAPDEGGAVSVANPPLVRVALRYGIDVGGGRRASTLMLRSPTWGEVMWGLSRRQFGDTVSVGIATIRACTVGCDVEGSPLASGAQLTAEQVDDLHAIDGAALEEALDQLTPAPLLQVDIDCPHDGCGAPHTVRLDWRDPDFLG